MGSWNLLSWLTLMTQLGRLLSWLTPDPRLQLSRLAKICATAKATRHH